MIRCAHEQTKTPIHVIGGGLAGSEATWQIASARRSGRAARDAPGPHDGRPQDRRPCRARVLELVPLRRVGNERRRPACTRRCARAGSLILSAGDKHKLPAGGALAVDRDAFSAEVTATARQAIRWSRSSAARSPGCRLQTGASVDRRHGTADIAGPEPCGAGAHRRRRAGILRRHRAGHPCRDPSTRPIAWRQSRYDKKGPAGTGADYLNCPMTKEQYEAFIDALLAGDKTSFKEWEATTPLFRRLPAGGSDGGARARDACASGP